MKSRRGPPRVANVGHQDCILAGAVWLGYGYAGAVQSLQGGVLVHQPGCMPHLDTEEALLPDRTRDARVTRVHALWAPVLGGQQMPSFTVDGVVAQVSKPARPVDLGRDPFQAH